MANHGPRDGPMRSAELRVAPEKRFATSCAAETRAGVCVSLSFAGPWGTRSARPMDGRLCQLDVLAAWDTRTWERTPPGAETGHAPPLPRASGSRAPPSSGSSPPRGFLPWEPQASREASCPCGLHRVGGGRQQQGGRADQLLLPSAENGRAGGEHARNSTPARISPPQAGDPSAPRGPDWPVRTPRRPFLMSRWGKQGTQWCASKASRTRKRGSPLDSSLRLRSRPPFSASRLLV